MVAGARRDPSGPICPSNSGLTALAQYLVREGEPTVKRTHREKIVIDGQEHDPALGIWYSNQKQRRDRLTQGQLGALRGLGFHWA